MSDADSAAGKDYSPQILVFSTSSISDIGIDLAGSSHMHYSPSVVFIPLPCSSGIKPDWVLYALTHGFDGVFIAADGTDCPYLSDCTDRTGKINNAALELLVENGIDKSRLKMAAVCSVCAESFVNHMRNFNNTLKELGPSKGAD